MSTKDYASGPKIKGGEEIFDLVSNGEILIKNSGKFQNFQQAAQMFTCHYRLEGAPFQSSHQGITTMPVDIREIKMDGNFLKIFGLLPGSLEDNSLRHQHVWEFCRQYREHLNQGYRNNFFLIKVNEEKAIDWSLPWKNAVVLEVEISANSLGEELGLQLYAVDSPVIWFGKNRHRLITPVLSRLRF